METKQPNFKLEHESIDRDGTKFEIWSGPSMKGSSYKNMGVDPEKDRVFYIKTDKAYRFTYNDQIKLLDLVINNKQLEKAKMHYIIIMLEKLLSWIPLKYNLLQKQTMYLLHQWNKDHTRG